MSHLVELPIPSAIAKSKSAIELARIWAAGGKQHVSLATSVWNDPAAWGVMLVDLARHVAAAYAQTERRNEEETLARIKEGFDAEWATSTDKPEGKVLD